MPIAASQNVRIARFFAAMSRGERLAQRAARRQADIAPNRKARGFLLVQSRQEAFHALLFEGAANWLAPRANLPDSTGIALERLAGRIKADLDAGDFAASLVGVQIIFEGVGAVALAKLDAGLIPGAGRFAPVHRLLLRHEEAHHAFGVRTLERMLASGDADESTLREASVEYLALNRSLVAASAEMFADFDADAAEYVVRVHASLPACLS